MISIKSVIAHLGVLLALGCMTGCGVRTMVTGRVIDQHTRTPVEGAAVGIRWIHHKIGPPGLPNPKEQLGTTETVTDSEGLFTIPKYMGLGRSYYMGVYKKATFVGVVKKYSIHQEIATKRCSKLGRIVAWMTVWSSSFNPLKARYLGTGMRCLRSTWKRFCSQLALVRLIKPSGMKKNDPEKL